MSKQAKSKKKEQTNKRKINEVETKIRLIKKAKVEQNIEPENLGFDANVSSKSSSSGSCGSVLSLTDTHNSEPTTIDFECRTLDNSQLCMRKSKIIPYQNIFKGFSHVKSDQDIRRDDLIGKQYKIIKLMGKGTFSHVYMCRDVVANRDIALKIFTQRNQAALVKVEQAIAMRLKQLDPYDKYNFVKLLDTFRYKNQFFLVYESLGPSLYDFMSKIRKGGYTIKEIKEISRQVCATMNFFHSQKIIHTDIKPENILFVDQIDSETQLKSTKIKIIDFGSSIMNTASNQRNFGTVTTRHYRAPEVVMKLEEGWTYPIDVFSVGITLFEMYTQKLLFPSVISNLQHFVIMTFSLGELPFIYRKKKPHYFAHLAELDENEAKRYKLFEKYFELNDNQCIMLVKFIRRMLVYDPNKRATMNDLLNDPFLKSD